MSLPVKPSTLRQLRESGWQSKPVKREIHDNFLAGLSRGDELFPGIVGYDSTVIPETNLALLAGHDMLFLGEKGQGKSRMMRSLVRFLDAEVPYLDIPGVAVHEDPYHPITTAGKRFIVDHNDDHVPIGWWSRQDRYAERMADEMKLYSSDLDRMGMLSGQALRATRLVVDSGLHTKGWTRQQAIDYMLAHTAEQKDDAVSEVDR